MLYDVAILGGGPAGLSAAIAATKNGLKVVCIERKNKPGIPVHCAEGVGKFILEYCPIKIPKEIFKWKIDGIHFWHDNSDVIKKGGYYSGYTIDRSELEKFLYDEAVRAGAIIFLGCEVKSLNFTKGVFNSLSFLNYYNNSKETVSAKRLIISDGADSFGVKCLGYKFNSIDLVNVYSKSMNGVNLVEPRYEQVIFSKKIGNGYGYIFPKSKSNANVGIGIVNTPQKKLEDIFYWLINSDRFQSQFNGAHELENRSKSARFGEVLDRYISNNVIITGDSANINYKPLIEGIIPAIISGYCAGLQSVQSDLSNSDYVNNLNKSLPGWKDNLALSSEMARIFSKNVDGSMKLFELCTK